MYRPNVRQDVAPTNHMAAPPQAFVDRIVTDDEASMASSPSESDALPAYREYVAKAYHLSENAVSPSSTAVSCGLLTAI